MVSFWKKYAETMNVYIFRMMKFYFTSISGYLQFNKYGSGTVNITPQFNGNL